jgi:hypothetical protein
MHCTRPRLWWQHSSSSSNFDPSLSPPNLDGSTNEEPSTNWRPLNGWNVPAPVRQPGRVADRIRAINSLQQLPSNSANKAVKPDPPINPPSYLPPEPGFRRASPFPRRDSAQSPIRPDTPLSHSHPQPPKSPLVHCPIPRRFQPQLSASIEQRAAPNNLDPPMCYRHGRKLKLTKSTPASMSKAYSGAYIPTGLMIRQQVDLLSPWAIGRRLAKTSGTTVSPDTCPDCLAEQDILKRETSITSHQDHPVQSSSSSLFTERGTPPESIQPSNVLVGTTIDNQTIDIPGATVYDLAPDKFGGIVATDLGDMIDAIIIEHSGSLDKVISNIRNGMPDSDWTQKLSRHLAKVSEAVASLPDDNIKNAPAFSRNINGRRSIILDASPESLRKKAKTMPELLDLIDAATEEFGIPSTDKAKLEASKVRSSNVNLPHLPGNFPGTPSSPLSSSIGSPIVHSSTTPTPSIQPVMSIAPSPSLQVLESHPKLEPLVSEHQVHDISPIATPTIISRSIEVDEDEASLVEKEELVTGIASNSRPSQRQGTFDVTPSLESTTSSSLEADEDEATLVDKEDLSTSTIITSRPSQRQGTLADATSSIQQRSRIPKANTTNLTKSLHALSDGTRSNQAISEPRDTVEPQRQQRTFQQGWLKEAAIAERVERRTRSRGAKRG